MFDYLYPGCFCSLLHHSKLYSQNYLTNVKCLNMYLCFFNVYVHTRHVIMVGLAASISQKQNPKKRKSSFLSYISMDKIVITLNGLEDKDRWKCVNIMLTLNK